MSYLFPQGDKSLLGVVQVGANINVDGNSVISIAQDVSTTANITFNGITVNTLSTTGNLSAGNISTTGTGNIGTLVVPGTGTITGNLSAGNITTGTATVTTLVATNETVTGNITAGNVITTGNVYSNGLQTITSVTPSANVGISLSNVVTTGPAASFQINNTGVLKVTAGTGISLTGNTGNVTISATGATIINTRGTAVSSNITATDDYVGATTGGITLTLPVGVTGQSYILKNESASGDCTVAATSPDTIDGSATKKINNNASITVVYRAGAWRII